MIQRRHLLPLLAAGPAALAGWRSAAAQDIPRKNITLVVGFAAGGARSTWASWPTTRNATLLR